MAILLISTNVDATDTFSIPLQDDTIDLDPMALLDSDSVWIATQLYDGLFEIGPTGDMVPRLVSSWQVEQDGRVYEFTLRRGVRFSDGSPLTTRDVEYTLTRLREHSVQERAFLKEIERVQCLDDQRIIMVFSTPVPNFPQILTSPAYSILPSSYAKRIEKSSFFRNPIGSGPFMISTWNRGKELVLQRNPHYWAGRPQIREIRFSFYNPQRPWTDEELYQFDMLLALPAYSSKVPIGFSSRWYTRPVVEFIAFNVKHPFWSSRDNRKAFAALFNRRAYYQKLFQHRRKSWRMSTSIIPRGVLSTENRMSNASVQTAAIKKVSAYLMDSVDEVYFASHRNVAGSRLKMALMGALEGCLDDSVVTRWLSLAELQRMIETNDIGFFFTRMVTDLNDPYEILVYFSDDAPIDFTHYRNRVVTEKLRKVRLMRDEETRAHAYTELAQQLADDVVVIPIASMFNERLFINARCTMKDFGCVGPWLYRMDNIRCE